MGACDKLLSRTGKKHLLSDEFYKASGSSREIGRDRQGRKASTVKNMVLGKRR